MGKPEGKRPFVDLVVDGRIILKMGINECYVMWIGFICVTIEPGDWLL